MAVTQYKNEQGSKFSIGSGVPTHSGVTGDEYKDLSTGDKYIYKNNSWLLFLSGGSSGVVSSVGLIMPAAFTVSNSPITSTGDLTVTGAGTTAQYVRGDGTLATFPLALPTSNVKHTVKYGEALTIGQAVYVSGADGTNMVVSKASNASEATSSKTMGLVTSTGATNYIGEVITEGLLAGLDTSTATEGDAVWLGTNGNLIFWHYGGSTTKPVAPAHLVFIGIVTRVNANNGEIFVRVQNGFELDEIHDVSVVGRANNTLLGYNSSTSLHEFKSIATWLGYTPANDSLNGLNVTGGTVVSTDNVLIAFGKLQNQLNAIASPMIYQGTWNASTNSPALTSSTGTKGYVYRVTTSGSTNIDGITDWKSGDFIVYNGTTWDKWDSTDAVTSINGYTGAVTLVKADVGLSNVENTALSTWAGSANITTLGTIGSGTWNGTPIADSYLSSAFVKTNGTTPLTNNWNAGIYRITTGNITSTGDALINSATVGLGGGAITSNIALGVGALTANTTGIRNVAIGTNALATQSSTGNYNIAIGFQTMYLNTDGQGSIAIGDTALRNNTTGTINTAIGAGALNANTTGIYNTAIGYNSLILNTTYGYNIGIGAFTLASSTGGTQNIAIGHQSLTTLTNGGNNTAFGYRSAYLTTTGNNNTALGPNALYSNTTGSGNLSVGVNPLFTNTTGSNNLALGNNALFLNSVGDYNAALGTEAGYNITGSSNIAFGYQAGKFISDGTTANTTPNQSIYIGTGSKALTATSTNEIVIGYSAIGNGSNSVVLGNNSITTTILKGNVGIGITNPTYKLDVAGNTNISATSGSEGLNVSIVSTGGGGGTTTGITSTASGSNVNYGGSFIATGTGVFNTGVIVAASNATTNIGVQISVSNGTNKYALALEDGSQGVGKFLKNTAVNGRANWATISTTDISGFGTYAKVGTYTSGYIPRWNGTTDTLASGSILDNGSKISIGEAIDTGTGLNVFMNGSESNAAKFEMQANGVVGAPFPVYGIQSIASNTQDIAIAGYFEANGDAPFALQLKDGSNGVDKFLSCVYADGTAAWRDINDFTAKTTPNGAVDYILIYDASTTSHKKVLLNNLPGVSAITGTPNYVARFGGTGALGTGLIRDDNATVGINAAPDASNILTIISTALTRSVYSTNQYSGGSAASAGYFDAQGPNSGNNTGVISNASGSTTANIGLSATGNSPISTSAPATGIYAESVGNGTGISVGIRAVAAGTVSLKYSAWLQDGTQGAGKFLKDVSGDGKANWASLTEADVPYNYGAAYALSTQNVLL
jgi:hypothetical protein